MPRIPEKCRLLHGPYDPPPLKRGDRADCYLRGTVKIISWTAARISWPRCLPLNLKGQPRRNHPSVAPCSKIIESNSPWRKPDGGCRRNVGAAPSSEQLQFPSEMLL
jgi:hypothetical protein